jgi:hypothetical protein
MVLPIGIGGIPSTLEVERPLFFGCSRGGSMLGQNILGL